MKRIMGTISLLLCLVMQASGQDTLSLVVIGDLMMHTRQMSYDGSCFLEYISDSFEKADFTIANMEFTLSGEPYSGYPSFSAPDQYALDFADAGIDVFLTANNHILDRGDSGLVRTISVLDSISSAFGTRYTGIAADEESDMEHNPLMLEKNGIKIALVNFTYGTNSYAPLPWPQVRRRNKSRISEDIKAAKQKGADFVIAFPHWGDDDYAQKHDATQQQWAEWLVSEGVDLIIGGHPHVVQDAGKIGKVPVYYSLGNAVSNMTVDNSRLGLSLGVELTKGSDGARKVTVKPRWLWCCVPGTFDDNYRTIAVEEFEGKRELWDDPQDYDNMMKTLSRVQKATNITAYAQDNKARSN